MAAPVVGAALQHRRLMPTPTGARRLAASAVSVYLARVLDRSTLVTAMTLSALVALVADLRCADAAAAAAGEALYMRYCASCHGMDGKGDGTVASALNTPPPDLTRLEYGEGELMKQIDGRRTIRAHGTPAMPVWGEVFEQSSIGEPHRRRTTLQRVQAIADYVLRLRGRPAEPRR
jgi:mono/diheme cytochrome c family protein